MTIAGAPIRGYRFEKATGDTPVHRWTRDQMEAAFFVDLTSETIIVALLRRSGQNSETSSVKLPFQQIREIVRNAEHARTVDVLAVHSGGPGDTVTHGRMILIVLPAGLAPQTPAVLFSDLRWHDGNQYNGIALPIEHIAVLERGVDLNQLQAD